ncbi:hypothetical protein J6E39_01895 [bacterium]|nr:hypothetical protein [bacterium]
MNVGSCIVDNVVNKKFGKFIRNKLPKMQQNSREQAINSVSDSILSEKFFKETMERNWQMPYGEANASFAMDMLDWGGKEFVAERANFLLNKTYLVLAELYKGKNEIIIPFSGGRDSSAILAASLAFFPKKSYTLVCIQNGMSKNAENVQKQVGYLKNIFTNKGNKPDVKVVFIDASKDIKKHVIDSAYKDKKELGSPALCSGCKFVMEKNIWNYVLSSQSKNKSKNKSIILMGYNKSQANQSWLEQSPLQVSLTEKTAKNLGIKLESPLYNVIETPYDSRILLASLGIPLKHHKNEMKCCAGGMNPRIVDLKRQIQFSLKKNEETNALLSKTAIHTYAKTSPMPPEIDLSPRVRELELDKSFIENTFNTKVDKPKLDLTNLYNVT